MKTSRLFLYTFVTLVFLGSSGVALSQTGPKPFFLDSKLSDEYHSGLTDSQTKVKNPAEYALQDLTGLSSFEDNVLLPLHLGTPQYVGKGDGEFAFVNPELSDQNVYNIVTLNDANHWLGVDPNTFFQPSEELVAKLYAASNYPQQIVSGQLNEAEQDNPSRELPDFVLRRQEMGDLGTNSFIQVYHDYDGSKVLGTVADLFDTNCIGAEQNLTYYDVAITNLLQGAFPGVLTTNNCGNIIYFEGIGGQQYAQGVPLFTYTGAKGRLTRFVVGHFGLSGGDNLELVAILGEIFPKAEGDAIATSVLYLKLTQGGVFEPFAKVSLPTCISAFDIVDGDLNGDAKRDFAVSCLASPNGKLSPSDGRVYVLHDTKLVQTISELSHPQGIDIGDLNQDGKADIAVALRGINSVAVLRNGGSGCLEESGCANTTASTMTTFNVNFPPEYLKLYDFNEDGKLDISLTTRVVRLNSLQWLTQFSTVSSASSLALVKGDTRYYPNAIVNGNTTEVYSLNVAYGSEVQLYPTQTSRVYSTAIRGAYVPENEVANYTMLTNTNATMDSQPMVDGNKFSKGNYLVSGALPSEMSAVAVALPDSKGGDTFQVLINTQVGQPGVDSSSISCSELESNFTAVFSGTPPDTHPDHPVTVKIESVTPAVENMTQNPDGTATVLFPDTKIDYVVTVSVTDTITEETMTSEINYGFKTACPPLTPVGTPFTCPGDLSAKGFEGDIVKLCAPAFTSTDVNAIAINGVEFVQTTKLDKPILASKTLADSDGCVLVQLPYHPFNVPYTEDVAKIQYTVTYNQSNPAGGVETATASCDISLTTVLSSVEGSGWSCKSSLNPTDSTSLNLSLLLLLLTSFLPWMLLRRQSHPQ